LLLPWLPTGHEYQVCGLLLLLALPLYRPLSRRDLADDDADDGTDTAGTPALAWWQLLARAPAIVWSTVLFALFDALVLGLLPLYARAQGLDEAQALLSASVVLAGDTALEWVVGALADRYGRLRLHVICALVLLAGAPLLPLAVGSLAWWPLLFVIGGAAGGIYVLSLMASGQCYSGRPLLQITALLGAAWGAASAAGPLLTGVLMEFSPAWALPAVLFSGTAVLLLAIVREEQLDRQQQGA
jgi:MFS family permease